MTNVAIFGTFMSGKTTLANELAVNYGYRVVSLAGNLKANIQGAYGTLDKGAEIEVLMPSGDPATLTIRQALQQVGEVVKNIDQLFWVRWFLNDTKGYSTPLVVDDGRLPLEAKALREQGWLIVRVDTPDDVRFDRYLQKHGRVPRPSEINHSTETRLDEITYDVVLDGELDVEIAADLLIGRLQELRGDYPDWRL